MAKPVFDLTEAVGTALQKKKALPLRDDVSEEEAKLLRGAETAYINAAILDTLGQTYIPKGSAPFPTRSSSQVTAETALSITYDNVFFAKQKPVLFSGDKRDYGFMGGASKAADAMRETVNEVIAENKTRIKENFAAAMGTVKTPEGRT